MLVTLFVLPGCQNDSPLLSLLTLFALHLVRAVSSSQLPKPSTLSIQLIECVPLPVLLYIPSSPLDPLLPTGLPISLALSARRAAAPLA